MAKKPQPAADIILPFTIEELHKKIIADQVIKIESLQIAKQMIEDELLRMNAEIQRLKDKIKEQKPGGAKKK